MVFKTNKKSPCFEYDEKINSCIPCKDKAKRNKCGKVYKKYKTNDTLENRLEFYQEGCIAPECYDVGHCQYLEGFDATNPYVIDICKQARKNIFYPLEREEIDALSIEELQSILFDVKERELVIPEKFMLNVKSKITREYSNKKDNLDILEENYKILVQEYDIAENKLDNLYQNKKKLEKELEEINKNIKTTQEDQVQSKKISSLQKEEITNIELYLKNLEQLLKILDTSSSFKEPDVFSEEEEEVEPDVFSEEEEEVVPEVYPISNSASPEQKIPDEAELLEKEFRKTQAILKSRKQEFTKNLNFTKEDDYLMVKDDIYFISSAFGPINHSKATLAFIDNSAKSFYKKGMNLPALYRYFNSRLLYILEPNNQKAIDWAKNELFNSGMNDKEFYYLLYFSIFNYMEGLLGIDLPNNIIENTNEICLILKNFLSCVLAKQLSTPKDIWKSLMQFLGNPKPVFKIVASEISTVLTELFKNTAKIEEINGHINFLGFYVAIAFNLANRITKNNLEFLNLTMPLTDATSEYLILFSQIIQQYFLCVFNSKNFLKYVKDNNGKVEKFIAQAIHHALPTLYNFNDMLAIKERCADNYTSIVLIFDNPRIFFANKLNTTKEIKQNEWYNFNKAGYLRLKDLFMMIRPQYKLYCAHLEKQLRLL